MTKLHFLVPTYLCGQLFFGGNLYRPCRRTGHKHQRFFHGSSYQLKRWGLGWEDAEARALHWIPASLGGSTLLTQPWLPSFLPVLVTSLVAMTRYSMQSSMKVKGFISALSLRVEAIMVKRHCVRSVRQLVTSLPQSGSRERRMLVFGHFCFSVWDPSSWNHASYIQDVSFLSS